MPTAPPETSPQHDRPLRRRILIVALGGATAAAMVFAAMQAVQTFRLDAEALEPAPPPDVMAHDAHRRQGDGDGEGRDGGLDPMAFLLEGTTPMAGASGGTGEQRTEAEPLDLPPPPGGKRLAGMMRQRHPTAEHWSSWAIPGGERERIERHYTRAAKERDYRLHHRDDSVPEAVNLVFTPSPESGSGPAASLLTVHLHEHDPQRLRVLVSLSYPVKAPPR